MTAALKTAVRLLVRDLGGVEAAASVVARATSIVSDWQNHAHPLRLPSLDQVVLLEAAAPVPHITAALARAAGQRLEPLGQGEARGPDVISAAGRLIAASGAVASRVGEALADGLLSLDEKARMAEAAASARDECDAVLAALAGECR